MLLDRWGEFSVRCARCVGLQRLPAAGFGGRLLGIVGAVCTLFLFPRTGVAVCSLLGESGRLFSRSSPPRLRLAALELIGLRCGKVALGKKNVGHLDGFSKNWPPPVISRSRLLGIWG